jgi:transcriptional regulator with XRE-family HTH domain
MSTSPLYRYRKDNGLTLEALAAKFGVQKAAVWKWERNKVPADKALAVEDLTGISRHDLRPDIFGPSPREAA